MRLHKTSSNSGDGWKGNHTRAYLEDYGSPTTVQCDPYQLCRYDAQRISNALSPPLFGSFCNDSAESLPLTPFQPRSLQNCDESGAAERDKEDVEEGRVAGDDATMRRPEEGLFDFDNLHVESPQEEHAVSTQASIKFC